MTIKNHDSDAYELLCRIEEILLEELIEESTGLAASSAPKGKKLSPEVEALVKRVDALIAQRCDLRKRAELRERRNAVTKAYELKQRFGTVPPQMIRDRFVDNAQARALYRNLQGTPEFEDVREAMELLEQIDKEDAGEQ